MKNLPQKRLLSLLAFLAIFAATCMPVLPVQAKVLAVEPGWSVPVNLSHSGGTSTPKLVIDSSGRFHAVWVDGFNGYMASESSDGLNWSKPIAETFPFGAADTSVMLLADSKNMIHAFWRDNSEGLSYSRVAANQFAISASWEKSKKLAESAVNFSAVIDNAGTVHLAYIRKLNADPFPSGVYYRNSIDNGVTWTNAAVLYQSLYFRAITTDNSNVKVAASSESGMVYVTWDDRQSKRIYLAKSTNGGKNWSSPSELVGPDANNAGYIPFNINISANGKNVLMIWQMGQPYSSCDQYSQWSSDNGNTWSNSTLVYPNGLGCSSQNQLNSDRRGKSYLFANIYGSTKILIWNGAQWSSVHNVLSAFSDPETINNVSFSKQSPAIQEDKQRIFFVGYDANTGGDTWLASLSLADIAQDLFPSPDNWSKPGIVTANTSELAKVKLLADYNDHLHIFWTQKDQQGEGEYNQNFATIHYAYWDGRTWAAPVVIAATANNNVLNFNAIIYDQRLYLTWETGSPGNIYFSWVDIEHALFPSEWATPKKITNDRMGGSAPALTVSAKGTLYLSYAIPLNENRGVYILKSTDKGLNWSVPMMVGGSSTNNWNILGDPNIVLSGDHGISVIWTSRSLPGQDQSATVFTNHSNDEGVTWEIPANIADGIVSWVTLMSEKSNNLERFWLKGDTNQHNNLWHQFSTDGGKTWNLPASPSGLNKISGIPTIADDSLGRVHLFTLEQTPSYQQIDYLFWDNQGWQNKGVLSIGDNHGFPVKELSAAISASGKLTLAFVGKSIDQSSGNLLNTIFFSTQKVDLPAISQTPAVSTLIVPTQATKPVQTESVNRTTTPSPVNQPANANPPVNTSNAYSGLFIAAGLTVLIILGYFVYFLFLKKP
jgi:hypothetical protein